MNNPFEMLDRRLEKIEEGIIKLSKTATPEPKVQERYLTTEQVCELLSITRVTLWSWDKKGITQPIKIGNLKRYKLSDIEAMAN